MSVYQEASDFGRQKVLEEAESRGYLAYWVAWRAGRMVAAGMLDLVQELCPEHFEQFRLRACELAPD